MYTVVAYFLQNDRRFSYYPGETFSPAQLAERGLQADELSYHKRRGHLTETKELVYQQREQRSIEAMVSAAQQDAAAAPTAPSEPGAHDEADEPHPTPAPRRRRHPPATAADE